ERRIHNPEVVGSGPTPATAKGVTKTIVTPFALCGKTMEINKIFRISLANPNEYPYFCTKDWI
uniref:hypothetical protein n=1 Tax=Prevotella sp. TaxID=59823 RepID=UPI004025CBAF